MEVHFSPDLQARLTERASQEGRNLDQTVQDVAARYFEEEERFIEAVKRGEAGLCRRQNLPERNSRQNGLFCRYLIVVGFVSLLAAAR